MAYQIDTEYTGTINNLIFYKRNGKFLIRTVPVQAAASQRSAEAFGIAASKAKALRTLLTPLIPDPKDKDMQYRLASAIQRFLHSRKDDGQQDSGPLAGFEFVSDSELKNCLHLSWQISFLPDGKLHFGLPSMNPTENLTVPEGTSRIELRVMAVSFDPARNESFAGTPKLIDIPYSNETRAPISIVLETGAKTGNIVLLTLALGFFKQNRRIVKEGFMPVEIVAVLERP